MFRWEDGKKPEDLKKEAEEAKEEEEEDVGEDDPNDMSIPVGIKKLMRRCFNPVTGCPTWITVTGWLIDLQCSPVD